MFLKSKNVLSIFNGIYTVLKRKQYVPKKVIEYLNEIIQIAGTN